MAEPVSLDKKDVYKTGKTDLFVLALGAIASGEWEADGDGSTPALQAGGPGKAATHCEVEKKLCHCHPHSHCFLRRNNCLQPELQLTLTVNGEEYFNIKILSGKHSSKR